MDRIKQIDLFPLEIPRDTPYLGPLEEGIRVSERGYFVRPGNQTIYSVHDHTLLVKLTTERGLVGWGESFGVVTPRTAAAIIEDLLTPLVIGRDPHDVVAIAEDIYNGMRVRGFPIICRPADQSVCHANPTTPCRSQPAHRHKSRKRSHPHRHPVAHALTLWVEPANGTPEIR